jgi:hypothetical protein
MRALLFNMQCRQEQETIINSTWVWVNNTAAIAVATGNNLTHETLKHVTIKVRFLQECVQKSIIRMVYIKTCKDIADFMTKQSAGPQFAQHSDFTLGRIKTCKNIADFMTKQSAGPQFAQHSDFTLGRIDVFAAVISAAADILRKFHIRSSQQH